MMEPFCQHINCRIDRTEQDVYIILAFKYLARFFLVFLPQPFTHKESAFSFKLFRRYILILFFLPVRTDHDGRKQFLRRMQKILWDKEVME